MARVQTTWCSALLAALVLSALPALPALSSLAQAQDEAFSLDEDEAEGGEKRKVRTPRQVEPAPGPERRKLLSDEQALEEERAPNERFRDTTDPYEDPRKSYLFFGAGWRFSRVPTWLLPAYGVEAGPAVSTPLSVQGELAWRKDGFQVLGSVGFTRLNMRGPFQLRNDPIEDTEWLEGNFKFLNLTATVTWSTAFTDWFQIEYGFEAGLGFLFGDLTRSEAYKRANGSWGKCPAWASQTTNRNDAIQFNPLFPSPTREQQRYCDIPIGDGKPDMVPPASDPADRDGAQYGVKAERGLFNGGVPHVVPILGPRLSLRFKPVHQVVLRVDVPLPIIPFGIMGGVAAQYGF
jgi:hypothetical protein